MTPALKNYLSTRDEFIADYLDRHGHNQATRTEAEDLADEWRDVARDLVVGIGHAMKRAESVMGNCHVVFDVVWEAFSLIYVEHDDPVSNYADLNTAAIKLAMSEGES